MAHHHTPPTLDQILAALRAQGMRVTAARQQVVQTMLAAASPLSIEALHARLGTDSFDLVTLYRNLDAFVAAEVAQVARDEQGKAFYEIISGPRGHHHHVMCRQCGKFECLDECDMARFEAAARALGYRELSHRVEIYGVCADCRA